MIGSALVVVSTFLYTGDRKRNRPPPIHIASYQKTTIDPVYTPKYNDEKLAVPSPIDVIKAMGLSTSRPASPLRHHSRSPSARDKNHDE